MCSSPYCTHSTWIDDRAYTTQAGRDAVRYAVPITSATITFTTPTYTNGAWQNWVSTGNTSTITFSVDAVWGAWVRSDLGTRRVQREEAQRWVQESNNGVADIHAAVVAAAEERRAQRVEASQRAEELLRACLNAEQRDQLTALDRFSVTVPSGRTYWIHRGYAGNVRSEGSRYCIHGPMDLPYADQMLMQKLLLETDEAEFLRVANATPDYEPALVDNTVMAA